MEIPMLLHLLCHRQTWSPHRVHHQWRRYESLHGFIGNNNKLQHKLLRCKHSFRNIHLPIQPILPHRLLRRKFSVLHRCRPNPAPYSNDLRIHCKSLALELRGGHGHTSGFGYDWVQVLYHVRHHIGLHPDYGCVLLS